MWSSISPVGSLSAATSMVREFRMNFDLVLENVMDLNVLAGEGESYVKAVPGGAQLAQQSPIPLRLYRNGILMFNGPFRSYEEPCTQVAHSRDDNRHQVHARARSDLSQGRLRSGSECRSQHKLPLAYCNRFAFHHVLCVSCWIWGFFSFENVIFTGCWQQLYSFLVKVRVSHVLI